MKAAILERLKKPLVVADIEVSDTLLPGQVRVRILAAGLCGSQLHEIDGNRGEDKYLPHLLGHEGSGIVEEVGLDVTKVKKGDYVVISWIKGTGANAPGGIYSWGKKKVNSGSAAVFAEQSIVSENRLTKISKKVPHDVAALLGCAVPTGAGVIRNTLKIPKGSTVAIFGSGGVGASAILGAVLAGAKEIIAVDISASKLKTAKKLGATMTIDASTKDPVAAIRKKYAAGIDFAVEAAGITSVMQQAFASISNSGTLGIAGHPKEGSKITLNPFEFILGKKIVGSWGGATNPDVDIPYYAKEYLRGNFPIDGLISHSFSLDTINDAVDVLRSGKAARVVISFPNT
ncbi:MAG TPA: zinc-binding dehydrogenase [Candidatus Andersenbacteria bacterium]|nr:zinc-binding dehydrogenase [Candidatus Andersenbacteria bacterium]